jgi:hypothetical protein
MCPRRTRSGASPSREASGMAQRDNSWIAFVPPKDLARCASVAGSLFHPIEISICSANLDTTVATAPLKSVPCPQAASGGHTRDSDTHRLLVAKTRIRQFDYRHTAK